MITALEERLDDVVSERVAFGASSGPGPQARQTDG